MYKNYNYIPTIFGVNALCKCNDFSRSFGTSMIFFFFAIKFHLFRYKALCGCMRHFVAVLVWSWFIEFSLSYCPLMKFVGVTRARLILCHKEHFLGMELLGVGYS